jgi:hypothetical protein
MARIMVAIALQLIKVPSPQFHQVAEWIGLARFIDISFPPCHELC